MMPVRKTGGRTERTRLLTSVTDYANYHCKEKRMPKTFSTPRAAKLIGVHVITVHRWLAEGLIEPASVELEDGRKLWRWTDADIAAAIKLKESRKSGPKPKSPGRKK